MNLRRTRPFAKHRVAARLEEGGLIHTPSAVWEGLTVEPGPVTKAYPDGSIRVTVRDNEDGVEAIFLYRPTRELLMVGTQEWDAIHSQYTRARVP